MSDANRVSDDRRVRKGARVLVNGWGSGVIVQVGGASSQYEPERYVIVEDKGDCRCRCGNRHQSVRRTTADLMHVTVIS